MIGGDVCNQYLSEFFFRIFVFDSYFEKHNLPWGILPLTTCEIIDISLELWILHGEIKSKLWVLLTTETTVINWNTCFFLSRKSRCYQRNSKSKKEKCG